MDSQYPDVCLQSLAAPWWTKTEHKRICRGRLIHTFIPYADHTPQRLVMEGRTEATEHGKANYRLEAFDISRPSPTPRVPVAGATKRPGEEQLVYRGKRRPALVLGVECPQVPRALTVGAARYQTLPTILIAPFYGIDNDGTRGGWKPELVDRIRRCEFPQYLWDSLPSSNIKESLLRMDAIHTLALSHNWYDCTDHCLSDAALDIVDQWVAWLLSGQLKGDSLLGWARGELMKVE